MQFLHTDLGHVAAGSTVRVNLRGTEANVLLLDGPNFTRYQNGRDYHYYGGHFIQSPALIEVPDSGHWYVAIDLGGFAGRINANVEVLAPGGFVV